MTKILMVGNDSSVKGGITTVISQFRNYDWSSQNVNFKFIPTYVDKNNVIKILFFCLAMTRITFDLIFFRPDIIHIHMSYKGSFTRANTVHRLCKLFKINDIIHLHGSEFKKWYDEIRDSKKQLKVRRLLKETSVVVVLGKEWEKRIKEIEPEARTIIVNNTIKLSDENVKYRKEKFNVLFLGVLIKRKGVHDLLSAISILKEKNILDNVNFTIAGTGDEKENLEKQATSLEISKYINFFGWVNDKEKRTLLADSQLLVLPSYNEGLPMAILEGISVGLPVISTNVGDISEAIINEKNGYLIDPGDVEKLAYYLEKIILAGEENWKKFSENSKEIASEKFSDKKYFDIFKKIYKGEL
mgnify:CR=1 FL=1